MTVVSTRAGRVEGALLAGGVHRFLGVPYAAAPIGERRFREAQPHPGWSGVWNGTRPGATSPQAEPTIALHRRFAMPGWINRSSTTRWRAGEHEPVVM